jgi:hypothetical protein
LESKSGQRCQAASIHLIGVELRTTDAAIVREIDDLPDTDTDAESPICCTDGIRTATMRPLTRVFCQVDRGAVRTARMFIATPSRSRDGYTMTN